MKALAVVCNFFIPGLGSLVIGKAGLGIAQFLIWLVGLIFTLTAIGAIIGLPMMLGAWVWGLMIAVDQSNGSSVVVTINNTTPTSPQITKSDANNV